MPETVSETQSRSDISVTEREYVQRGEHQTRVAEAVRLVLKRHADALERLGR